MVIMALMLAAPVLGNPNGPPWENGGGIIVETGCTCHGGGAPSTEVVVSISGVPRAYNLSQTYEFTIDLQHASNDLGGFVLYDYNAGTLTAGEGSQQDPDEPGAISQSEPGNDWVVTWTAPSEDIGSVNFQLVGNAVNGNGLPDEGDKWNIATEESKGTNGKDVTDGTDENNSRDETKSKSDKVCANFIFMFFIYFFINRGSPRM